MYCPNCGQQLSNDVRFCWNCGTDVQTLAALPQIPPQRADQKSQGIELAPKSDTFPCPVCKRNDQVRKVSAIVAGDTHIISGSTWQSETYVDKEGHTHTRNYSVPYSGTQISILAQRLSSPEKPKVGSNWAGCFGMLFIASGGLSLFMGLLALAKAATTPMPQDLAIGMPFIFIWGVIGLLLGLFIYNATVKSHKERLNRLHTIDIPRWERAIERWNRLYHCGRDDDVFVAGENKAASSSQMMQYIYEQH